MRKFVTLQAHRYRVSSIQWVSERVVQEETFFEEAPRYGFWLSVVGSEPAYIHYDDNRVAVAVLDDLHKLLEECD